MAYLHVELHPCNVSILQSVLEHAEDTITFTACTLEHARTHQKQDDVGLIKCERKKNAQMEAFHSTDTGKIKKIPEYT